MKEYFVYILQCRDQSLYTGYTTDPQRRLKEHNNKKASKYTRSRTPVKMVYLEKTLDLSHALKKEHYIKSLSRKEKLALINFQTRSTYEKDIHPY